MQTWVNICVQTLVKKFEPERSAEDDERRIMKNMEISTGEQNTDISSEASLVCLNCIHIHWLNIN